MTLRHTVLLGATVALSGCFDFDGAYAQYCDGGRCTTGGGTASGGGGGTTGGGSGGGVTGGGSGGGVTGGGSGGGLTGGGTGGGGDDGGTGGGSGGGTTGGGGGTTGGGGGTVDAGCPDFLCPQWDWLSTRSSRHNIVTAGIMSESLTRFMLYAVFQTSSSSSSYAHYEYRFNNTTTPVEVNRTGMNDNRVEGRQLRGVSINDYWEVYRTYASHYVNGVDSYVGGGLTADGGLSDPWHYAVFPVSAAEAWFVGYPMAIHHWTQQADGGTQFVEVVDPTTWPTMNLNDVYVTPAGEVYAVGNDRMNSGGYIFRDDGSVVQSPLIIDNYYDDAFHSIDGTGDRVYVLHRSNPSNQGSILERLADGGFDIAYTAPFRLARLDVEPSGEVWAVGQNPAQIVYFDGGAWATHTLPTSEFRTNIRWENLNVRPEGLILSGWEEQEDGGLAAVVNTYRRFGQ